MWGGGTGEFQDQDGVGAGLEDRTGDVEVLLWAAVPVAAEAESVDPGESPGPSRGGRGRRRRVPGPRLPGLGDLAQKLLSVFRPTKEPTTKEPTQG